MWDFLLTTVPNWWAANHESLWWVSMALETIFGILGSKTVRDYVRSLADRSANADEKAGTWTVVWLAIKVVVALGLLHAGWISSQYLGLRAGVTYLAMLMPFLSWWGNFQSTDSKGKTAGRVIGIVLLIILYFIAMYPIIWR